MDFAEALEVCTQISALTAALDQNPDVMSPQDRVDLYVVADKVLDELGLVVRNTLRPDAIAALADLEVPEGGSIPSAFALGVKRTTKRKAGRVEWAGWSLCDALATDLVDIPTGEIARAVPVDVLREVLPACNSDRLTSSRWRLDGLRKYVKVDSFRRAEPDEYSDDIEVTHLREAW